MSGSRLGRLVSHGLASVLSLLPTAAAAQAWLPPKGEGAVSLTFGDYAYDGHFDSDGSRDPFGGTHSRSLLLEVVYAFGDRLAVAAGLPFVTTRLRGGFPRGVPLGPLDDGNFHGDFQDLRVELRVQALAGPLAIAPFAGVGVPTGYEVVGEAVPGKGIKELVLGANVGWAPVFVPRAYVHGRYSYAILEKVLADVSSLDRSNLDLELGHALDRRWSLRAGVSWQVTHGGLDLEDMRTNPQFFRDHDRAARTNFFNVGAGATWDATDSFGFYGMFLKTLSGENAHQARSIYLGASYRFGGGFGRKSADARRP